MTDEKQPVLVEDLLIDKKQLGSVLVVGGGISGMQSALDLAESGYLVYLVEEKNSIGGIIAKRDKLFPANDCAMCTMSPLLIDVIRNNNIDVITGAELIELAGEAGNFKAAVLRKISCLSNKKSSGCDACARVYSNGILDGDVCSEKCIDACGTESTSPETENRMIELEVGAVILSNRKAFHQAKTMNILSREGIFACGAFCEPKDIDEILVDAGSAAAGVSQLLAPFRGSMVRKKDYVKERDVSNEKLRVGVFVCKGNINIGGVINAPRVTEYARTLNHVVYAQDFPYLCSKDNIIKIKETIVGHHLNRVVVASCSPNTLAPLFQDCLQEAGLNRHLYEQANIREQVSWVHREVPGKATEKAKDLVKMAVAKVRLLKPVNTTLFNLNRRALVVGGGVAGMVNALSLGDQGYEVVLVEKTNQLGGQARHIEYTITGNRPGILVKELVERIHAHHKINVVLNAKVSEVSGHVGDFHTVLQLADGYIFEVQHGVVIIAIGAQPVKPDEYLYGKHPLVITQQELEQCMSHLKFDHIETVVMIQCVGSREQNRPYCSRICCAQAAKNAIKIKEQSPATNVLVLYRDIGTYGFKEKYYVASRQKGVRFIRYSVDNKPLVTPGGSTVSLQVKDDVSGLPVNLKADILVLSSGIEPREDNKVFSKLFNVPLNNDGFFRPADMKLRPVDFTADGLYMCGLAHGPKSLEESIAQAHAAAIRAVTILSKEGFKSLDISATVDQELCRGCGLCIKNCPYGARVMDEHRKVSRVHEVLCRGCGACVSVCPSGASQQKGFEKKQLLTMIDAALSL